MKTSRFSYLIAVFIICCAGKCKNSNNDYLTNLYNSAYKSYAPVKAVKEPLYTPLIGYWNLMDDRPLVVTKKDETTYEFKFLSPYLNSEDIIYEAQVNTIAGSKYISMQSYKGNYIFFKMKPVDEDAINFFMLRDNIMELMGDKSLAQFISSNAHLSDTSHFYKKVALSRLTQEGANEMQMRKIRASVQSIYDYETYFKKFPGDPNLPEIKAAALTYSLNHAASVDELMRISASYPESAEQARYLAKKGCEKTEWCVDYINAFPDDNAKDSILNVAFDNAHGEKDYKYLLQFFPTHQRSGQIILSLALEETGNIRDKDKTQAKFEEEYSEIPSVIVLVNTIRIFDNFQLDDQSFITNSYALSAKGKAELDKVAAIIANVNKDNLVIGHLYIKLQNNYEYGPDKEKSNFLQSANKCLSIRTYFESKGLKEVTIHVIPLGMAAANSSLEMEEGKISVDPSLASTWSTDFYSKCYAIKQSDVIPDADKSSNLNRYIRIPEIENYILQQLIVQIPLYKNKQAYLRVVPPNYWNAEYKATQPGFEEFRALLLQTAKKNKLKKKHIPFFVAG
jgi:hypothetical protein